MTDLPFDSEQGLDYAVWLWLIRNGDKDQADCLMDLLIEKLMNDSLTKEDRYLLAIGLKDMIDAGKAGAFFNNGKVPHRGSKTERHLDAFHHVSDQLQMGADLEIALERAAAEMDYIPAGASDEKRDEYLTTLKSEYKQGREKMKQFIEAEEQRFALVQALKALGQDQE